MYWLSVMNHDFVTEFICRAVTSGQIVWLGNVVLRLIICRCQVVRELRHVFFVTCRFSAQAYMFFLRQKMPELGHLPCIEDGVRECLQLWSHVMSRKDKIRYYAQASREMADHVEGIKKSSTEVNYTHF